MMKRKIFFSGLIFSCFLLFSGCVAETKPISQEEETVSYKNDMTAQAIAHAQEMQMLVITMQDENAVLRARNEELQKQIEKLQAGQDIQAPKLEPQIPLNPDDLEQKFKNSLNDIEELRKLVQYERGLRDNLLKKIDQDQEIIQELKNRIGE